MAMIKLHQVNGQALYTKGDGQIMIADFETGFNEYPHMTKMMDGIPLLAFEKPQGFWCGELIAMLRDLFLCDYIRRNVDRKADMPDAVWSFVELLDTTFIVQPLIGHTDYGVAEDRTWETDERNPKANILWVMFMLSIMDEYDYEGLGMDDHDDIATGILVNRAAFNIAINPNKKAIDVNHGIFKSARLALGIYRQHHAAVGTIISNGVINEPSNQSRYTLHHEAL